MGTKQDIIDKIKRIDDPGLLKDLDKWITSLLEASVSDEYSKEEISAVREGYNQYKAGETVSQDEANKIFNKWLKEK